MKRSDLKFMPRFFDRYILLLDEDKDLISGLNETKDDFESVKALLTKFQEYKYQPGKWTPKDILQHVIDNERIQTYRALVFSRNDTNVLPGYDEQLYARHSNASERTIEDLLEEFQIVRQATIFLFRNFTVEQFHQKGICFEIEVTPLALGFQIIGHQIHHMKVLEDRYFS